MVVDTSVLIAILQDEPEAESFLVRMRAASSRFLSVASVLETSAVLVRRKEYEAATHIDELLDRCGLTRTAVSLEQADLARRAYRQFGRGQHAAALNFGDCFSYSLAVLLDEALLSKGNDFSQTDVKIA